MNQQTFNFLSFTGAILCPVCFALLCATDKEIFAYLSFISLVGTLALWVTIGTKTVNNS